MIKNISILLVFILLSVTNEAQVPNGGPSELKLTSITPFIINVIWKIGSTNHEGYKIELSVKDSTHFSEYSTVTASKCSALITNLPSEATRYFIRVRAYNSSGYSKYITAYIHSKPNCPHGLIATAFTNQQIKLEWKVNSEYQDGTAIERSNNGLSGWIEIARVFGQDSIYTYKELTDSKYYYRVRAFKSDSFSPYSHVASINITSGKSFSRSRSNMEISDNLTGDNSINNYYIYPSGSDKNGDGSI